MIRHVTDDLDYIGRPDFHPRYNISNAHKRYQKDALECLYSLLDTIYIPDDVKYDILVKDVNPHNPNHATVVYKGDLYFKNDCADCYELCKQLVIQYFPDKPKRVLVKAYTYLIEEVTKNDIKTLDKEHAT